MLSQRWWKMKPAKMLSLRESKSTKKNGGSRLPPLVNSRHKALIVRFADRRPAGRLVGSATLLAAALFLALFLFITIALLAAALLSGSRRFDWFIRLTFFFHITFLLFTNRSSRFAKDLSSL